MILFGYIIEIFDLAQTRQARQRARLLHRFGRARIGPVLVNHDRSRSHSVLLLQCLPKETECSGGVSPGAEQDIDRLTVAVNRAVEIGPSTLDLELCRP